MSGLRKAVTDYKMISDGDHVVVGLSGGKDSIVLVTALKAYQRFSPEKFSLTAVNINIGFKDTKEEEVERLKAYL
ncbi:MAG: tRNA 2-thiocytidine(32) synthetase TtcA, partial [Eubacteriales bacterium]|nr:tRNA 2-thiocytidine(32) synthetase TtcA [Eubacteriales bacterium]